jgi:F-type H+-transporting ATPase subunit delta
MQAASRESYAAAAAELASLASEASPEELLTVAEQLLAVARLLAREPRLRRALADPGRAGEERADLLRGVLEGNVDADAQRLLAVLVGGRWSAASELLDGTERLAVDALLASADRAGRLAEVEDELFRFGQITSGSPQLAAILGDTSSDPSARADLVRSLLDGSASARSEPSKPRSRERETGSASERSEPRSRERTTGKADEVTIRLAEIAVSGFGGRGFTASLIRLVELAAEVRNRSLAYVTVAIPLTDAEEQRLGARLTELYGRDISLKITVDPDVVGGVRVQVGNDLYDGTIARRLAEARTALAGKHN